MKKESDNFNTLFERNRSSPVKYRLPELLFSPVTISATMTKYSLPLTLLTLVMSLLLLSGCGKKQSNANDFKSFDGRIPDTISIMEYNVENLFDMQDNGSEYPEFKPNACNWTISTLQKKLENISDVIVAMRPDICVMVEIENENALKNLLSVLKEKKRPFNFYAVGDKPDKTITVPVIISRFPFVNIKWYAVALNEGTYVSRNILEADVFLGRDTLKVFACHWPSKKEPESIRYSVAEILKGRLKQLPPSTQYIIAGDLNENYDECADFHTLGLDDTKGKTGINHVLGTVKSFSECFADYVTKTNIRNVDSLRLFDPWLDITEEKRMSEIYHGRNNTPDHILLSPSLFDSCGISYLDKSFSAVAWDGRLLYNGAPFRWQMRFEKKQKYHKGEGYSDHLPIMLKLRKGGFDLLDSNEDPLARSGQYVKKRTTGFETGFEGWVSCATHIKIRRDTSSVKTGSFCLKISGEAGKQNCCAARTCIARKIYNDSIQHFFRMSVRGKGSLSLRIKMYKDAKWTYYNGKDFKIAGAAKYTEYDFQKWTGLAIPLIIGEFPVKEIIVEIRVKKQSKIELWIDDVKAG
jgi:endonuclease/exonuclease/phosphatase family metal-dependent hydrolase